MKEKEWRGFAVQSVVLLVVVLILSVFHPGDIIRENGTKVMADGTAAAENNRNIKRKKPCKSMKGPSGQMKHMLRSAAVHILKYQKQRYQQGRQYT